MGGRAPPACKSTRCNGRRKGLPATNPPLLNSQTATIRRPDRRNNFGRSATLLAPNEGSLHNAELAASTSKPERERRGKGGSNTHRATKPLRSLLLARVCLETPEKPPILRLSCLLASPPSTPAFPSSGTDQDVRGVFFSFFFPSPPLQLQLTRRLRWVTGMAAPLLLVLPLYARKFASPRELT